MEKSVWRDESKNFGRNDEHSSDVLWAYNGQSQRLQITIKRAEKLLRDRTPNASKKGAKSADFF